MKVYVNLYVPCAKTCPTFFPLKGLFSIREGNRRRLRAGYRIKVYTCIRFQKCTTLATDSVAMEHPGPNRATKVIDSFKCSIRALIAYASEHYERKQKIMSL